MAPVVLGMDVHCYGCIKKIKKAVKKIPGAGTVEASFVTNLVAIEGTADAAALRERVEKKLRKKVTIVFDGIEEGEPSGAVDDTPEPESAPSSPPPPQPAPPTPPRPRRRRQPEPEPAAPPPEPEPEPEPEPPTPPPPQPAPPPARPPPQHVPPPLMSYGYEPYPYYGGYYGGGPYAQPPPPYYPSEPPPGNYHYDPPPYYTSIPYPGENINTGYSSRPVHDNYDYRRPHSTEDAAGFFSDDNPNNCSIQ